MRFIIIIFSMLTCGAFAQTTTSKGTIKVKKVSEPPLSIVDTQPEFPGGKSAMFMFVGMNLKYPQSAIDKGVGGTCDVSFVIEEDGSMSDIKILRGVPGGPECDAEALRVISMMPRWSPGINKGAIVRVQYHLPFRFTLG